MRRNAPTYKKCVLTVLSSQCQWERCKSFLLRFVPSVLLIPTTFEISDELDVLIDKDASRGTQNTRNREY